MKTLIFLMPIMAFVLLYSNFRASQTGIEEEICEEVNLLMFILVTRKAINLEKFNGKISESFH